MTVKQKPHLVLCSFWGNVTKANTLSGIPFYLKPELEKYFDLRVHDDINEISLSRYETLLFKSLEFLEASHKFLWNKKMVFDGIKLSWCYLISKKMDKVINQNKGIPVLSFGLSSSVFIKKNQPVFQYLDGIYTYKRELYPWANQNKLSVLERFYLKYVDQNGSLNAKKIFTTSATIKNQTTDFLNKITNNVNIINVGIGSNVKESGINQISGEPIKLLFIYTNFKRKGGDIVYEISKELSRLHIAHEIHFVGKIPEEHTKQPNFKWYGYINKVREEAHYINILRSCNINLMPTLGDLTPHTICECNSFGIPTIANNVGGIKDLIGAGGILINGLSVQEYVHAIKLVSEELHTRAQHSYEKYLKEQKWSVIAEKIAREII